MKNATIPLHRDYYTLEEAAERCKREVADLVYLAATGGLTVYVIADRWSAARIYQVDNSTALTRGGRLVTYSEPPLPEMPDTDDPDFEDKYPKWLRQQASRDMTVGRTTVFGRYGEYGVLYDHRPTGPQPVAKICFEAFRINSDTAQLELDVNRMLQVQDDQKHLFFRPDPEVLLKDAFRDGKLVVMASDLLVLIASTGGSRVASPPREEAGKMVKPDESSICTDEVSAAQYRNDETKRRVARWQELADEIWAENWRLSRVAVAKLIEKRLVREKWASRAAQTIRNNIKKRKPSCPKDSCPGKAASGTKVHTGHGL